MTSHRTGNDSETVQVKTLYLLLSHIADRLQVTDNKFSCVLLLWSIGQYINESKWDAHFPNNAYMEHAKDQINYIKLKPQENVKKCLSAKWLHNIG